MIFAKNQQRMVKTWTSVNDGSGHRSDHEFHTENVCLVYISHSDQYQMLEMYYSKCIIIVPIISQVTPICVPKQAPAKSLTQLHYCSFGT